MITALNINIPSYYIVFGILGLFLFIQLYYLIFVYSKLARYKIQSKGESLTIFPPISVLICAHNEEDNLKQYLPAILNQDYPNFEVIVINDCSDDDTYWIIKSFQEQYPNLKTVQIKEHIKLKHSKKFALTLGIKSAKNEHLIMTDADCEPQSTNWLKEIVGAYQDETQIVLGYSPYFKEDSLLNKLIRFETTQTAMNYLSYALRKNAYMGVGRNLSYTKELFFEGKGFTSHMHIKSGDDDLFVNQNATRSNVAISIHPDAHVYSVPKSTWKSYYKQKSRHAGASVIYKKAHQRMLGVQLLSALLFYIMIIVTASLFPIMWYVPLAAYFIRYIIQLIIFTPIYNKLAVKDLLIWLPILDVFFYFYICFNGLFNRKKKQKSWK